MQPTVLPSTTANAPPPRVCPQCQVPLAVERVEDLELDRCARCDGIFFDPGEATAVLGPAADPEVWGRDPRVQPPYPGAPLCPSGHGPMWLLPTGDSPTAPSVHACGQCRGAWIDAATLRALRDGPPPAESGALVAGRYVFQLLSAMPLEVSNPVQNRPWVTWSLAASMVVAFAALRVVPAATKQRWEAMWMVFPSELLHGYGLLTPLTYAWVHHGVLHLLGNLYFFLIFGDNVEDRFGRARYALFLALAGAAGAAFEVVSRGDVTVGVGGASGAIAGVLGAYMVLFPTTRLRVVFLFVPLKLPAALYFVFWAGLQVFGYLKHSPGVAWLAHVGGFVVGVAAGAAGRLGKRRGAR